MTTESFSNSDKLTSKLELEYSQVNENFRMLAEIRFKLLAFVPALGGVAVFVLSKIGDSTKATCFDHAMVLLLGTLGFLVTLGITFYDQRNSELYNALSDRAKYLEEQLKLPHAEKKSSKDLSGGQFRERPRRGRKLVGLILMGHDTGLALIYGPVIGAWFFPIVFSVLNLRFKPQRKEGRGFLGNCTLCGLDSSPGLH